VTHAGAAREIRLGPRLEQIDQLRRAVAGLFVHHQCVFLCQEIDHQEASPQEEDGEEENHEEGDARQEGYPHEEDTQEEAGFEAGDQEGQEVTRREEPADLAGRPGG